MRANPEWERIKIVGEGWTNYLSRVKTYIDLRGGALEIHEVASGKIFTSYFKATSILKSHRNRRDGTLLIRAAGAPLAGLLVFLLLMAFINEAVPNEALRNIIFSALAIAILVLVSIYSLVNIVHFFSSKQTTWLLFSDSDANLGIEFWHIPGRSSKLDLIVESTGGAPEMDGEVESVVFDHNWSYVYPFKNAVLLTVSLSLLILVFSSKFEVLLERHALESLFIVWLGFPPIAGVIYYLRARFKLSRYRGKSRKAIEDFVQGDYRGAETALHSIIEANPEDGEALALLMHLYIENGDYLKAAKCVDVVESTDEEWREEAIKEIDLVRNWREGDRTK